MTGLAFPTLRKKHRVIFGLSASMLLLWATLGVLLFLYGCATGPATPKRLEYDAWGTYGAALSLAVAYEGLPRCPALTAVCSDPIVVQQLRAADDNAYTALTIGTTGAQAAEVFLMMAQSLKVTP